MLRLNFNAIDYAILALYFVVVLGIGFAAKRYIKTSLDYFLSGRSLPAWVTGLAFVSANLGALEILGMAANGAQYGVATVHFYWIGAVPAMVFLGLVMMPFYYGRKVRSVPEYLRLRFNNQTHVFNALTFALATVLISGREPLRAWRWCSSCCWAGPSCSGSSSRRPSSSSTSRSAGLSSAIYNEVLQFFVISRRSSDHGHRRSSRRRLAGLQERCAIAELGRTGCTRGRARGRDTPNPIGASWIRSSSASASCSRSATGRRTSPRSSGPVGQVPPRAHAAHRRLPEDLHPAVTIVPGSRRS
jgi:SSS family solute:Na+ symporter